MLVRQLSSQTKVAPHFTDSREDASGCYHGWGLNPFYFSVKAHGSANHHTAVPICSWSQILNPLREPSSDHSLSTIFNRVNISGKSTTYSRFLPLCGVISAFRMTKMRATERTKRAATRRASERRPSIVLLCISRINVVSRQSSICPVKYRSS